MEYIRSDEISLHPSSLVDPNGRLFVWENQLFRGIDADHASFYRQLFAKGLIDQLVSDGFLVETELGSIDVEGYAMVLKHRRIPFVSYAYEWTGTMLKDAALFLIDFNLKLAALGLTTQDAHPWNILFDGAKPVFVDIGSIIPMNPSKAWAPAEEFRRFFLRPIDMFACNERRIARWLLRDYNGILEKDISRIVHSNHPRATDIARDCKNLFSKVLREQVKKSKMLSETAKHVLDLLRARKSRARNVKDGRKSDSVMTQLAQFKKQIESTDIPIQETLWSTYYDRTSFPSFSDNTEWTPKHKSVVQIFEELRPATVLDVASNRGWYSHMAARLGSQVVASDNDESAVALLYKELAGLSVGISPVVMDILNPSPGYGWLGRGWALPASDRYRCDMVLALALVHHLVFRCSIPMRFAHIVDLLGTFTNRWLLVEFIPPDDMYVSEWYNEAFNWYTLSNFVKALEQQFYIRQQLESHPAPRVLLLCERKRLNTV
jgi:SAM-dependent methyltransferase